MAIRLTERNIGENKYIHKFMRPNGGIITVMTTASSYNDLVHTQPVYPDATWVMSSIRIGFDTPTGDLGNKEFATQANGYHWVKLRGYVMRKIPPEYIVGVTLSPEGAALIETEGNAES